MTLLEDRTDLLGEGQNMSDIHQVRALPEDPSATAAHMCYDPHEMGGCGGINLVLGGGAKSGPTPNPDSPLPQVDQYGWLRLRKWSETFADAQDHRVRNGNRLGFKADGTRTKTAPPIEASVFSPFYETLFEQEAAAKRGMVAAYREAVPQSIQDFVSDTKGLGEPSMALLLGIIGHPRIAVPHFWMTAAELKAAPHIEHTCDNRCKLTSKRHLIAGTPYNRTVSQLLQYCGHGAPSRRRKGMTQEELLANGSPKAKDATWTCSSGLMKQKKNPSEYRLLYEELHERYLVKKHSGDCVRCGPSGSPALVGSTISKAHANALAIRVVGKAFLKDLWAVSA